MRERDDWHVNTQIPRPLRVEISRPGLLARMEREVDVRLIALFAPSGYGKTTLLAQYARAVPRAVAWLTLTAEMADPLALADALAFSIRRTLPQLDLTRFEQAQTDPSRGNASARALARDLGNAEMNLQLILDQGQYLSGASGQWLDTLIGSLPEGHQVLLGGYDGTALRLSRLIAREQVLILGDRELAFTPDESRVYLHARGLEQPAEQLYQVLEGWPAGLALSSAETAAYVSPSQLIQEALEPLSATVRRALPEAAALSIWSEQRLLDLGVDLPLGWLQELVRAGLPLTPLGQGVYRPHRLIVDELRRELAFRPERAAVLYRRVGALDERSGNLHEALSAYGRGGCFEDEQRVLYRLLFGLTQRGEHDLALHVLSERDWRLLPPALQALAATIFHRTGRQQEWTAVVAVLQETGAGTRPEVARVLAEVAADRGQFDQALAYIEQGLSAPRTGDVDWTVRLQTSRVWILRRQGRNQEAWQRLEDLIGASSAYDAFDRALLYSYAASVAVQSGHLGRARLWAGEAVRIYQQAGTHRAVLEPAWDLAYVRGLMGETALGLEVCETALQRCPGDDGPNALLLSEMQANLHFWNREFETAARLYEQVLERVARQNLPALEQRLRGKLAEALFRQGRREEGAAILRALREEEPLDSVVPLVLGVQAFLEGREHEAGAFLERALQQGRSLVNQWRAHVLLAELAARRGALGDDAVASLTSELERFGSAHLLALDAGWLPQVRAVLGARGWKVEGAPLGEVENAHRAAGPGTEDHEVAGGRPHLRVRVLGARLEATLNGQVLDLPHSRARELLFLLVVRGSATRDELVDALWNGDADPHNTEYFKVIVRRLRSMLSAGPALAFNPLPFERGRYALASELQVSLDLTDLREALAARDPGQVRAGIAAYDLRGLGALESEWGEAQASEARELVREAAVWLATQEPGVGGGSWAWQRLVETDPLDQEVHLHLIAALSREANEPGARLAYKRYARMMKQEYDADEIEEFEQLVVD